MSKSHFDSQGDVLASPGNGLVHLFGSLGVPAYNPSLSHAAQVVIVMRQRFMFLGEAPSQYVFNERCRPIIAAYRDLTVMGYTIKFVAEFRLIYALALLYRWRWENLDRSTITGRWDDLRQWVIDIDKPGMLGHLDEIWPVSID